ncbi:hypothetical protein AGMMS49942_23250 [Spirochaetia bacterium]|nr:hypothetical protein AGMMS49942_23250 [Spirochaetia bacterium]
MYAMKKHILLPRKDHEVYFLSPDPRIKGKKLTRFIADTLPELHPGFSAATVFDTQSVTLDTRRWIMITVIKQEVLTEYRIVNPGALFYTATALLVHLPGFADHPFYYFPGETIGYSKDTKEPVSLPQNENGNTMPGADEFVADLLVHASGSYCVFKKKARPLFIFFPLLFGAAALCVFVVYHYHTNTNKKAVKPVTIISEPAVTIQTAPGPFMALAETANAILNTGGTILLWRYNENAVPTFMIDISGSDTVQLFDALRVLEYVRTNTISDIQYHDGKPAYTLSLSFDTELYQLPVHAAFTDQEEGLFMLSAVRTALIRNQAHIVSETLPSGGNGNTSCAIAFTCGVTNFVKTLEELEVLAKDRTARIEALSVSFDRQKNIFLCSCSFSKIQEYSNVIALTGSDAELIPAAFGYKKPPANPGKIVTPVLTEDELSGYTKIGVIRNDDNQMITYYRNKEGKIITQEENR